MKPSIWCLILVFLLRYKHPYCHGFGYKFQTAPRDWLFGWDAAQRRRQLEQTWMTTGNKEKRLMFQLFLIQTSRVNSAQHACREWAEIGFLSLSGASLLCGCIIKSVRITPPHILILKRSSAPSCIITRRWTEEEEQLQWASSHQRSFDSHF